jgi:predicted  nucleic acid-binding Zn-ribbon protein
LQFELARLQNETQQGHAEFDSLGRRISRLLNELSISSLDEISISFSSLKQEVSQEKQRNSKLKESNVRLKEDFAHLEVQKADALKKLEQSERSLEKARLEVRQNRLVEPKPLGVDSQQSYIAQLKDLLRNAEEKNARLEKALHTEQLNVKTLNETGADCPRICELEQQIDGLLVTNQALRDEIDKHRDFSMQLESRKRELTERLAFADKLVVGLRDLLDFEYPEDVISIVRSLKSAEERLASALQTGQIQVNELFDIFANFPLKAVLFPISEGQMHSCREFLGIVNERAQRYERISESILRCAHENGYSGSEIDQAVNYLEGQLTHTKEVA